MNIAGMNECSPGRRLGNGPRLLRAYVVGSPEELVTVRAARHRLVALSEPPGEIGPRNGNDKNDDDQDQPKFHVPTL